MKLGSHETGGGALRPAPVCLRRLHLDGAIGALFVLADFIGKAAIGLRGRGIAPANCALYKVQHAIAVFWLDRAVATGFVESLYFSEQHDVFLSWARGRMAQAMARSQKRGKGAA